MEFAERLEKITASQTLAITKRVLELKRQGVDVIGLGAGEPDFDTPEHIRAAAIRAIHDGQTRYTQVTGIPELREAITERLRRHNKISCSPEDIVVACGGKQVIATAILAVCGRGDEVLIWAPYWVSYPAMIHLAEGIPVIVPTQATDQFALDFDQITRAISPRTKAVIFCNPVNPSGAVYEEDQIEQLAQVLAGTDATIISDELYDKLTYDNVKLRSLGSYAELKDRVITVNGVSKAYAMTGWRIGYAAAPHDTAQQMAKIQSHMTSNPTSISQWAALAAITGPQDCIDDMVRTFKERRDLVYSRLIEIQGVTCQPCRGAFYLFPDISAFFGTSDGESRIDSALDLCHYLLEKERVALVPGEAFGSPNHVRISFATSREQLAEAMTRIHRGLQKLR